jgi:hypothetical protein
MSSDGREEDQMVIMLALEIYSYLDKLRNELAKINRFANAQLYVALILCTKSYAAMDSII